MSPWRRGAAVACILVGWAAPALAEPTESELATARLLFSEGVRLEDAHDWAGALERFRRVAAIKRTPQVRYNLGLCLAATGMLVEADNELSAVAGVTGDADALALASLARTKLDQLRPRIPRLLVTLPEGVAVGTQVTLDGVAVHAALVGTPMLVDPGPHTVAAAEPPADGARQLEAHVVAVEGATEPVVAALAFAVAPAPAPAAQPVHHKVPTLAYVTGGGAAVFLGTALALGIARLSAVSQLNQECGPGAQYCPASAHGRVNAVDVETVLADVLAGLGVASAGTTALLVHFSPTVPSGGAHGAGALVVGAF